MCVVSATLYLGVRRKNERNSTFGRICGERPAPKSRKSRRFATRLAPQLHSRYTFMHRIASRSRPRVAAVHLRCNSNSPHRQLSRPRFASHSALLLLTSFLTCCFPLRCRLFLVLPERMSPSVCGKNGTKKNDSAARLSRTLTSYSQPPSASSPSSDPATAIWRAS